MGQEVEFDTPEKDTRDGPYVRKQMEMDNVEFFGKKLRPLTYR